MSSEEVALRVWGELLAAFHKDRVFYVSGELALDRWSPFRSSDRNRLANLKRLLANCPRVPAANANSRRLSWRVEPSNRVLTSIAEAGPLLVSLALGATPGAQDLVVCDGGSTISMLSTSSADARKTLETFARHGISESDFGALDLTTDDDLKSDFMGTYWR